MGNKWLVVLLSTGIGVGSYFIAKLFSPKGKSPFGFHNYFSTIFFICAFTVLGVSFFLLLQCLNLLFLF